MGLRLTSTGGVESLAKESNEIVYGVDVTSCWLGVCVPSKLFSFSALLIRNALPKTKTSKPVFTVKNVVNGM